MYRDGLDAYKKVEQTTNPPRETEARVLTQGALKLKRCIDQWESLDRKTMLSEALRFNQKIWSIFQADLASTDSPLPSDLKLNLLRLGAFVDRQIFAVMVNPTPDKLVQIIDVNLGIAAGLRKKTSPNDNPQMVSGGAVLGLQIKG